MKIKQYSEYSEKYPAIDGIAKSERPSEDEIEEIMQRDQSMDTISVSPAERAIRSDIEKILTLSARDFNCWYVKREEIVEKLLREYEIVASIPDLRYGGEEQKYGLDSHSIFNDVIGTLKEAREYLEVIKKVYDNGHKE